MSFALDFCFAFLTLAFIFAILLEGLRGVFRSRSPEKSYYLNRDGHFLAQESSSEASVEAIIF